MADVLTGSNYVPRESAAGAGRRDRSRMVQRVLLALVVILGIAFVGEVVYHLVIAPRLAVTSIDVISDLGMAEEELLAIAGVRTGVTYFRVDESAIVARLEALPEVRRASAELVFPNRLQITAQRRQPLACAIVETPDGATSLIFDEEGVVFQVGMDGVAAALPVVSGLRFPAARTGLELPSILVEFLESLRELKMHSPEMYGLFSEYRVVRKNDYVYEVVLYPMHYSVPVRVGTTIDAGMLQYVLMMLDMLNREGRLAGATELDFRSGEGVLRMKGDDRG